MGVTDLERGNRLRISAITVERANEYVRQWHRHNKPRLAKFAIAVIDEDGDVRGVALVGRPVAPALDDGRAAATRRAIVRAAAAIGAQP